MEIEDLGVGPGGGGPLERDFERGQARGWRRERAAQSHDAYLRVYVIPGRRGVSTFSRSLAFVCHRAPPVLQNELRGNQRAHGTP